MLRAVRAMGLSVMEVAAVIGGVLTAFIVLLLALNYFFPVGLRLYSIVSETNGLSAARQQPMLYVDTQGLNERLTAAAPLIAVLDSIQREVKSKRADELVWLGAKRGMALYDRDSVQTFSKSGAALQFEDTTRLQLGENTLVVIGKVERDLLWPQRRNIVLQVDGELRGSISPAVGKEVHIDIATPQAITRIEAGPRFAKGADFSMRVDKKGASIVAVTRGQAQIITHGVVTTISDNETATIDLTGRVSTEARMPDAVPLHAPSQNQLFLYRHVQPRIKFTWGRLEEEAKYRLIVARDKELLQRVVDEQLTSAEFIHGNLSPGEYYWTVSASIAGGIEGPSAEVRRFTMQQDLAAPLLTVEFPRLNDPVPRFIYGSTEPGAKLFVDGQPATLDGQGRFSMPAPATSAARVIVVEAIDGAGNVTYQSGVIYGTL